MLSVIWSEESDADLAHIVEYIGQFNPIAATELWRALVESVEHLPEHPYMYRSSKRMPGCREIVAHPNYLVVNHVGMEHIEVLRVLHARRNFPVD